MFGKIVTLSGGRGPKRGHEMRQVWTIDDGAMAIRNGLIEWVGKRSETHSRPHDGQEVLDHRGKVITPGLVDAHAHPIFAGSRVQELVMRAERKTYQEIAAGGGGILSTVQATREASEAELLEIGTRHAGWFLQNGVTTVEAKSGYGLSLEQELKVLRVIDKLGDVTPLEWVPTVLAAHAVPGEHADTPEAYVSLVADEILPAVAQQGLAEYADAFFEKGYFDAGACSAVLTKARSLGLGIRIHADQLGPSQGAQLAAELGAKTADHLEHTDSSGIEALAKAGVQPVLLPGSVYGLGHKKYPEARQMIDAGLSVVLATDFNPGSSPVASLPFVMSLACTQMRMTPEEALTAVTVNAAHSLDRGHDRGSLEPGKRADFCVWDCGDARELAYWVGAPLLQQVFVLGKQVYGRA